MLWLKSLALIGTATAWTVSKPGVAVSGGGDVADRVSVEDLSGPVELFNGRSLDVALKVVETPAPHQVMLRVHIANDRDSASQEEYVDKSVLAKMRGNNAKFVLPYKAIPSGLYNHPLKASVIISGPSDAPLEQELFDLIVYGDDDVAQSPIRETGSGNQLAKKPLIVHQFRAPPKHVKALVAFLFIGGIDALFASLLYLWFGTLDIKLQFTVPQSATLVTVVLTELAFVGYYVEWSIFQLLASLAILLPILFVSRSVRAD